MKPGRTITAFLLFASACAATAQNQIPPPAWQLDAELGAKWNKVTGRYIYQVACASCHAWGPDHWSREKWESYLPKFPGNHQPDVSKAYADYTAIFAPGKEPAGKSKQLDALSNFILSAAPVAEKPPEERDRPFRGLPEVGEIAPDFSITDTQGRPFSLTQLKGKKHLVLVFSRAHW